MIDDCEYKSSNWIVRLTNEEIISYLKPNNNHRTPWLELPAETKHKHHCPHFDMSCNDNTFIFKGATFESASKAKIHRIIPISYDCLKSLCGNTIEFKKMARRRYSP